MSDSTHDVARKLVALLHQEKNVEAIEQLYADTIETQEADPTRSRKGKSVVLKSMQDFAEAHAFHYTHIEGPLISGDRFVLRLRFEATNRSLGQSFLVDELGVYTVSGGRIIHEQFFYDT